MTQVSEGRNKFNPCVIYFTNRVQHKQTTMDALLPPSFLKTFKSTGITGKSDSWKIEENDSKITVTLTWNVDQGTGTCHPETDKIQKKSKDRVTNGVTKTPKEPTKSNTTASSSGYNILSWLKSPTFTGSENVSKEIHLTPESFEPLEEDVSKESMVLDKDEDKWDIKQPVTVFEPKNVQENDHNIVVSQRTIKREIKPESTESVVSISETIEYDSMSGDSKTAERAESVVSFSETIRYDAMSDDSKTESLSKKPHRAHSIYKYNDKTSTKPVPRHIYFEPDQTLNDTPMSTNSSFKGAPTLKEIRSVKTETREPELIVIDSEEDWKSVSTIDQMPSNKNQGPRTDLFDAYSKQRPDVQLGRHTSTPCNEGRVCDQNWRSAKSSAELYHPVPVSIRERHGGHRITVDSNNNRNMSRTHVTTNVHGKSFRGRIEKTSKTLPERPPFLKSLNRVLCEWNIRKEVEKFTKKLQKERKWIPDRYHRNYSYENREIDGFRKRIRAVNQWLIVRRRFDQSGSKVEGHSSVEVQSRLSDSDSDREPSSKETSKKKDKENANRPPFFKSINIVLNDDEIEDRIQKFADKVDYEQRWIYNNYLSRNYVKDEIDGFRRRIRSLNYWHIEQKKLANKSKQDTEASSKVLPYAGSESRQRFSSSDSETSSNSKKSTKTAKRHKKELQNAKPAKCSKKAE